MAGSVAYSIDLTKVDLTKKANNLLFNIFGGLTFSCLHEDEIECLRKEFGEEFITSLKEAEKLDKEKVKK